jgi:hypothetical protein
MDFQIRERAKKFFAVYIMRRIQLLILFLTVELVYGPQTIEYAIDELVVLSLMRDAELYLHSFMKHYFTMGVRHIVLLDNNSSDGTIAIAQQYSNVTILRTRLPFKYFKMAMRHYLIARFAQKGKWALFADIDEHFDYPFSDEICLGAFLRYLNARSYTAVVAHMLDMFSDTSMRSLVSRTDDDLSTRYSYFDVSDVVKIDYYFPRNELPSRDIKPYFGGIRKTLFSPDEGILFNLTKHPLFLNSRRIQPMFLARKRITVTPRPTGNI